MGDKKERKEAKDDKSRKSSTDDKEKKDAKDDTSRKDKKERKSKDANEDKTTMSSSTKTGDNTATHSQKLGPKADAKAGDTASKTARPKQVVTSKQSSEKAAKASDNVRASPPPVRKRFGTDQKG